MLQSVPAPAVPDIEVRIGTLEVGYGAPATAPVRAAADFAAYVERRSYGGLEP
ncbi:hypothetical protein [Arthrobacter antioxidans]|uniref:hypothetical protein n=1 Tax=Arthrobacter antioxidans TaxID=2895818 RepID=UPI0020002DEB|nr:hypothetical protein [Arthrobacter antioxidans]